MSSLVLAEDRGGGWYRLPNGEKIRGMDALMKYYEETPRNGNAQQGLGDWDSTRVNRLRFARKAGLQYGNVRDVYTVAGYIPEGDLDFDHYWSRYERQHIAGRIVDMLPQTTWREAPDIVEPDMDLEEGTEFTNAFTNLADRLQLFSKCERIDRLSRIGRYGVLFIGTEGADQSLKSPIESVGGPDGVLYLSAYHEGDCSIQKWDDDPRSPRFGHPEIYRLEISTGVANFGTAQLDVHWSRIIHVAEDLLADEVFGRPALKRVMNLLMDLEKITASTAEAYWQLADKILMLSIDPRTKMGTQDRNKLGEAAEEMIHDLRRQIVGQGIDAQWLGGDTPDPGDAADLYMMLISAATGYPKRVLFGSETGERASTEDQKQYLGTVQERETNHAEPNILRPIISRFMEIGALPNVEEYEIVWPNRFQLDEAQEAELSKTRAETAKALTGVGGDPGERVVIDEDSRVRLKSTQELEEEREEREAEEESRRQDEEDGIEEEEAAEMPPGAEEVEEDEAANTSLGTAA